MLKTSSFKETPPTQGLKYIRNYISHARRIKYGSLPTTLKVHTAVDSMDGWIWQASKPGKGARQWY